MIVTTCSRIIRALATANTVAALEVLGSSRMRYSHTRQFVFCSSFACFIHA